MINAEMRRLVEDQKLGFVASVSDDGKPSVPPRGTLAVWDSDHLVFADICSPGTTSNLEKRPSVEINVVDQVTRRGCRFSGIASVISAGEQFEEIDQFYRNLGSASKKRNFIVVKVTQARAPVSPAYLNQTEGEICAQWDAHWTELRNRRKR